MIKQIKHHEKLLAIVIPRKYSADGIKFFTPDSLSQQLAYMNHPAGYKISPHLHNEVPRQVVFTNEALFIRSGKVRVDFYDEHRKYLESLVLHQGDVILLIGGGHGFEMLEPTEMIEVKQGPYAGALDKTVFEGVESSALRIRTADE